MSQHAKRPRVIIVGGGLAGMAAAVELVERGCDVALFEQAGQLGGRCGSFRDRQTGQLVDACQHVSMGCCTALADFRRRTGLAGTFRRDRRLHFLGPDGRQFDLAGSRWLPPPLHLLPGLLRLGYLTLGERLGILRAFPKLIRAKAVEETTVGAWLREHGQSPRAIKRFWSVVLVSALSETVERASLAAAQKVFRDGFLASRSAYELELPQAPLGEIFGRRMHAWLAEHGVAVRLGVRVRKVEGTAAGATAVVLHDGARHEADAFILAVPWRQAPGLLAPAILEAVPTLAGVDHLRPAAITAVHLWFDRPISPLPHAVLIGGLNAWVFRGLPGRVGQGREDNGGTSQTDQSSLSDRADANRDLATAVPPISRFACPTLPGGLSLENYYQVVISASHACVGCDSREVLAVVQRDLARVWPAAGEARLVHGRVVTQAAAVFSMEPGVNRYRPPQRTGCPNLALAGDWTATGWPATMEGAVRSGALAAEVMTKDE